MQEFIRVANQFGQQRKAFFFLIDFEQQKPLIFPLETAYSAGVIFDFFCKSNVQRAQKIDKPFQFSAMPPDYNQYLAKFECVKSEIQNGNSYLLNLTEKTAIETNYNLAELFYSTQAKYKLWLKDQFVCFSPECFVRIKQNKIYSYPMKGTINAEIENAAHILWHSEKEQAEHNTIVDLIRNDLALVATHITVSKYRYLEKLVTHKGAIYQTSSEICGELAENWQANIGTILATMLPAGSISGAPKAKTVEIIQRAEQDERGYYTGIFGYFDGESVESAVAIRYIEQQNGKYIFRSGGGITFLSVPDEEYNEIIEKVYVPISPV